MLPIIEKVYRGLSVHDDEQDYNRFGGESLCLMLVGSLAALMAPLHSQPDTPDCQGRQVD